MKFMPFTLFFTLLALTQNQYPKNDFDPPLDIPMQLSGNFGELRPNHFHAGFDFKTNQQEGLKVYAAADGYISRIKIATSGYGKAIYITHPNGYTTVYGHLQQAVGFIQEKIISLQYSEKSYEIESFFKPGEMVVKKGDQIALSGNTGGSEGPHLHFEIRDNKTEKIINPLFFGFSIKDTKKPIVSSVIAYPIEDGSIVNQSKRPFAVNLSLQSDGSYLAEKIFANGKIGFGISAYDLDNVSYNNNGTYKTQLFSNGKAAFEIVFDEMEFDEARYINAFIDYFRYKTTRQRVQKLFMKVPFDLSNINHNDDNGVLNVVPNFTGIERIEVSDFFNNKTVISIPVEYSSKPSIISEIPKTSSYFVKAKTESNFEKDNVSVYFPAGTFYEDFYMNFDVRNNILFLHSDIVPVHSNFTIQFQDEKSSDDEKEKMFIATLNGTKLGYNTTKRNGTTFSCRTRTLGQFTLAKDTTAPKISISKSIEGKWITAQKSINITISDDLSGIKTYNGYLNGQWVLFEYESKLKRLTHVFNDNLLLEGANKLKVIVTDNVGNSTIFETQFNRSQKK